MEVPRQKRKYEKKQKVVPLSSVPHYQGPAVFNTKDLNQYDFPSSDDEPFSQVRAVELVETHTFKQSYIWYSLYFYSYQKANGLFF